ncbi:11801_t:CDS:2 [Dentiscutata erythropus]|uniref:11801_t:CDS:1 n=1 Tax=Dentiscutata erythropus TaxID=1348616 RepID=A0A9N9B5K8_9GLOM|nr:11801_t:CDS:2 [Dentiscutata erythropus]
MARETLNSKKKSEFSWLTKIMTLNKKMIDWRSFGFKEKKVNSHGLLKFITLNKKMNGWRSFEFKEKKALTEIYDPYQKDE